MKHPPPAGCGGVPAGIGTRCRRVSGGSPKGLRPPGTAGRAATRAAVDVHGRVGAGACRLARSVRRRSARSMDIHSPALPGSEEELEMADAGKPVTVQYFYKVRWGFQDEFVELFERNHWPLLRAQLESGRLLDVRAYAPRFHGDGRAGLDFRGHDHVPRLGVDGGAHRPGHRRPAIPRRREAGARGAAALRAGRGPLGHAARGAPAAAVGRAGPPGPRRTLRAGSPAQAGSVPFSSDSMVWRSTSADLRTPRASRGLRSRRSTRSMPRRPRTVGRLRQTSSMP